MKRKLLYILGGITLFLFIVLSAFGWYQIFYTKKGTENTKISNLMVKLEDNEKTIHEKDAVPTENTDAVDPYQFTVYNQTKDPTIYKVLLEDSVTTNIDKSLSQSQLSYELSLNGKVIKKGTLDEIKNNVLDERSIEGEKENKYSLKIWLNEDTMDTDWINKSYSYQITIQTEGSK